MKKMRKLAQSLQLLLISILFTSCIDYVQSITYKDGKYQMYYKVTLSKVLFALGNEDPEAIFESFDEDTLENLPENVDLKPVNTDLEIGAEFTLSIDPKTTDEIEKSFLPTVVGKKCFIPFLLSSIADTMDSDNYDAKEMTEAILSSAKCRVMISKKVISSMEIAFFEGRGSQNYSIPVFDYGENYCLEIPFIVLFESGKYNFDRIVIL